MNTSNQVESGTTISKTCVNPKYPRGVHIARIRFICGAPKRHFKMLSVKRQVVTNGRKSYSGGIIPVFYRVGGNFLVTHA